MSTTITYWLNLSSRAIYKYYGETKPLNHATEWRQVKCADYEAQFKKAV